MRLLTFVAEDGRFRLAVETDRGTLDVAAAATALDRPDVPTTMEALIGGGARARASLDELLTMASARLEKASQWLRTDAVPHWGPALPHPGKIVCVGLNYRQHAVESNMEIPKSPVLFSKLSNAIAAHESAIPLPADGDQFDYEAELAIVIGKRAYGVSVGDASGHIFGYCNANDFSCRDLQFRGGQWLLGKCFDGWCPIGPYLVTADEVADPNRLAVRCYVNGELRQDGNSSDMIFSCYELVSYISRYMTLEPGDIILTGTPAGVALGRPDKPWLKPGDEVIVDVAGLGRLRNIVGQRKL